MKFVDDDDDDDDEIWQIIVPSFTVHGGASL